MAKKAKGKIKLQTESALRKKYAGSGNAKEILVAPEDMLWIPSRFLALNDQWGGGIPYGKVVEVFGEESSGKSLIAFDFSYCTQALGGVVLWADAEFAFMRGWAEKNGIDLKDVELYPEKAIELISDWSMDMGIYWRSKLTNNEPILLVVDSIAALECLENLNSSQVDSKAEMGNRAKQMDKWLRTRNGSYEEIGMSAILINQLRSKIGASQFEDPDTTPGGKATRFYASIRVGVYGGKQITKKIKGKDRRIGRVTSIRIKKNKVAPPKPTLKSAEVFFTDEGGNEIGFNRYFGLADLLVEKDVLTRKKGSSRFYLGDKMIANGEEALIKKLQEDGDLRKKLIRKSGINTISRTQKQLDKLSKNLYPIKTTEFEKHIEIEDEE
jgi:recombination protein RecA